MSSRIIVRLFFPNPWQSDQPCHCIVQGFLQGFLQGYLSLASADYSSRRAIEPGERQGSTNLPVYPKLYPNRVIGCRGSTFWLHCDVPGSRRHR
jgi:hypothetical protein